MKYTALKDVCEINMGQSPESSSYNAEGRGIPFFQGNADFGERHPVARVWCDAPTKVANTNDILISVRAPIGAVNYATETCCIGRGLAAITPDLNRVSSDYIFWLLKGKNTELNSKGTGSTFKAINQKALEEIQVPDISFEKQSAYATNLETAYRVIQMRKQQLSALDDLIKARFVEMFGDPVSNQKGWEKKALSDEAEIKIGPFGSLLHKEDYVLGGHALVNPSHIINGQIVPDNDLTVSDAKYYTELSAYHLMPGDVVMGRRGEMGRCAVVEESGMLCGTGSLLIRTNGDLSADFIQKIISFPSFKRTIEDMAVGQTMPNLNVPIVSSFQIIKPPKSIQEQYYAFVAQIDKSKSVIQKSLDETQLLFDSMMQQYFG